MGSGDWNVSVIGRGTGVSAVTLLRATWP